MHAERRRFTWLPKVGTHVAIIRWARISFRGARATTALTSGFGFAVSVANDVAVATAVVASFIVIKGGSSKDVGWQFVGFLG